MRELPHDDEISREVPSRDEAGLPGPRSRRDHARWGLRLVRSQPETMQALHRAYGEVCAFGFGPWNYVFLFGPSAHRELFASDIDGLSWREATKFLVPLDGDKGLAQSDADDHRRRRRIVQPAFNLRHIESYVPIIVEEADRAVARWQVGEEIDVYEDLRRSVRRIQTRTLFGDRFSEHADELFDHIQPASDFVNLSPPLQLRIDLPWTRWHKTKRGRRRTDELVFAEIRERRAGRPRGDAKDVLTRLIDASDDGSGNGGLTDQEVRDLVVSLTSAGADSTGATLGWTLLAVLSHPEVLKRLVAEIEEHLGSAPVSAERVRRMSYLDWVVSESLRLWPPTQVAGRQVLRPIRAAGFEIPAGTMALYSPYVTHRLPEVWPEPARFRPERWDRSAPDYVNPPLFAFVPFGHGPRRCIGFGLATLKVKVLVAEVLRRVDLQLLSADFRVIPRTLIIRPRSGVRVRVAAKRASVGAPRDVEESSVGST